MNGITDYFGAEPLIIARLKALLVDAESAPLVPLAHYFTPFGLAEMQESSQPSPAIHVIYAGDVVTSEAVGQRSRTMINQRWLVILALRNARAQLRDTSELRLAAGVIVPFLLDALQGWAPAEWMRPLGRVSGPPAGYSSTFAYFPFMFEGRIVT